jgi:hypothetical protein
MTTLLNAVRCFVDRVTAHNDNLNDPRKDGTGIDAQVPTGDDYNDLLGMLVPLAATLMQAEAADVGDRFKSRKPELDTDHEGNERTTPAGSIWRVVEVNWPNAHLACDSTGAWIIPTVSELAEQFTKLNPRD